MVRSGTNPECFVGHPFTVDVFISYSHGDVEQIGESPFKEWCRSFWGEVRRHLINDPSLPALNIYFDDSHRPDEGLGLFDQIDPALRSASETAAILLALVSPHYLLSDYCSDERKWWSAGQEKLGFDAGGRLAPVLIWGDPRPVAGDWREALKEHKLNESVCAYLFNQEKAPDWPYPFGWIVAGEPIGAAGMGLAILEVCKSLRKKLKDFKELVDIRAGTEMGFQEHWQGVKPAVYLHGRSDDSRLFEQTFQCLSDRGYPVSPQEPEPVEEDVAGRNRIRQKRIETMAECDALLLVAPKENSVFSKELMAVGRADRAAAIARAEGQNRRVGFRLPAAVFDSVTDEELASRRKKTARNAMLKWFPIAQVDKASEWLQSPQKSA